jgi:hypothetical protein
MINIYKQKAKNVLCCICDDSEGNNINLNHMEEILCMNKNQNI